MSLTGTKFQIGDRVHIDGCPDLAGTITGVMARGPVFELEYYQTAWIANGAVQEPWIEAFRLTAA